MCLLRLVLQEQFAGRHGSTPADDWKSVGSRKGWFKEKDPHVNLVTASCDLRDQHVGVALLDRLQDGPPHPLELSPRGGVGCDREVWLRGRLADGRLGTQPREPCNFQSQPDASR